MKSEGYDFSNNWFDGVKPAWDSLMPHINPTKILEIGSYEGASACYLIETLAQKRDIEIHCLDTWEGGIEHKILGFKLQSLEKRFLRNVEIAKSIASHKVNLVTHKGFSDDELPKLIASGSAGYFDLIYVDGSHQAPDVLSDAILSFKLLKINGYMIFDDYLWSEQLSYGIDPIRCPKIAIDAFTNIFCRKISIMNAHLSQLIVRKISE